MNEFKVSQSNSTSVFALDVFVKKSDTTFKSMLVDEFKSEETFVEVWQTTLEKYFGQASQKYCHVLNAADISRENWMHNDFPYEKFLASSVDQSVLTWQPSRANPSQLDSEVQHKLTATLGKHAIVIPPALAEKLETDSALLKKVLANVENIYKFHTQPPAFKMFGVKEYGTKLYGSVTILNVEGDVENCVVTSGGTITGPDEKTLRQIESEQQKKLRRKEFAEELMLQARIEYISTRENILPNLYALS